MRTTRSGEVSVKVKPQEARVSMEAIAAAMGHQSKRTTEFFYWGVKSPSMIHIPINLKHRDDPKGA